MTGLPRQLRSAKKPSYVSPVSAEKLAPSELVAEDAPHSTLAGENVSPNYALHRPALQSSVSRWSRSQTPEKEARGGNNGDLAEPIGCHTADEDNPWWQVDLIFATVIDRIVIYNRQECAYRLRFFSLLASADGKEWHRFHRRTNPVAFGIDADDAYIVVPDKPLIARFLRLQLDCREALHFREFEVYGRRAMQKERVAITRDLAKRHRALRAGRTGFVAKIGELSVFVDELRYDEKIITAIHKGVYEHEERHFVETMLRRSDRVLEAGTAIGVVSMVAASCTSASQVRSFDGNPFIIADAKRNFAYNDLSEINATAGILKNRKRIDRSEKFAKFTVLRDFLSSRLGAIASGKDVVEVVDVPVFCLEDEIASHRANVLIIDIEGGEIDLLRDADLSSIRLIILEIHYWAAGIDATDAMIRDLIYQGFNINLELSRWGVIVLRRKLDWNQRWLKPKLKNSQSGLRKFFTR